MKFFNPSGMAAGAAALLLSGAGISCKSWGKFWVVDETQCPASGIPSAPAFARSTTVASSNSLFIATVVDCSGNVYAAGFQGSNTPVSYASGISISGAYAAGNNALLVKYNSAGSVLWAKTVSSSTNHSQFNALVLDSAGNIYAAGSQDNAAPVTYGPGVTIAGVNPGGTNPTLVKYDASGNALWARTVAVGSNGDNATFSGVALDSSGNIYTVGNQRDNGTYNYGSGVTSSGSSVSVPNAVIVKYNASGTAQWSRSVTMANADTSFNAIAIDSNDRIYAAGYQNSGVLPNYGSGQVTGDCGGSCSVLVRYDTAGNTLWGTGVTTTTAISNSTFTSVAVDRDGNIFAAGNQHGNADHIYNGATATAGLAGQLNSVVVRYNSSGVGQWAKAVDGIGGESLFYGVAVDSSGNIYAAGYQVGSGTFTYGLGVSATSPVANGNLTLVKYNSSGAAQWAKTVSAGASGSESKCVAVDAAGNAYAAGSQSGNTSYTFAAAVSVTGAYGPGNNAILLKFTP